MQVQQLITEYFSPCPAVGYAWCYSVRYGVARDTGHTVDSCGIVSKCSGCGREFCEYHVRCVDNGLNLGADLNCNCR